MRLRKEQQLLNEEHLQERLGTARYKVGRVFLMVAVPMQPHSEFGRNSHWDYALHFIQRMQSDWLHFILWLKIAKV